MQEPPRLFTVIEPVIARQPASQHVHAGETATLEVLAVATSPVHYQWWKDGTLLARGIEVDLVLTNLQRSDAGFYRVVVSNRFGCVTSAVARLTVNLATLDWGFDASASYEVPALAVQGDGKIVVGGEFELVNAQPRRGIASLNTDGMLDMGFGPVDECSVYAIGVESDGELLLGGNYAPRGYVPMGLARLHVDGTPDTNFHSRPARPVSGIAAQSDGKVLVAGQFPARVNPDGTIDPGFGLWLVAEIFPGAWSFPYVNSIAVQADGKILIGGFFTHVQGQLRAYIARLNTDGTLDAGFNPGADGSVLTLAVRADGTILVGGDFTRMGGQWRNHIAQLNADGTVSPGFNSDSSNQVSHVHSLAMQADGKILVGGSFTEWDGQVRGYLTRLLPDGNLDEDFNPMADNAVLALGLQADGKVLVGGAFTNLAGKFCSRIARLNNTDPATQSLNYDGSTITWLRGGTSPEVWRTTFDYSTDGVAWTNLGAGIRIVGGWQLTGVTLPAGSSIRARGFVTGGRYNGSTWFVETQIGGPIRLNVARQGSDAILNWTGGFGPFQVQQTTELGNPGAWENVGDPTQTNSMLLPIGSGNLFLHVLGQ